ncbi:hypothetical protein [Iningainema tapete]|uniref:Uncharacterized protein n=1 Tax=Iningainema tapete BLCC-T55 TaxID=2748662 RepID=A0A8J6XF87_9CYAN|nr:hypothetical protein [Iningainema tapete]MBD2772778.1 hypothetical protein [Iningainema tapete BLCC-T55]
MNSKIFFKASLSFLATSFVSLVATPTFAVETRNFASLQSTNNIYNTVLLSSWDDRYRDYDRERRREIRDRRREIRREMRDRRRKIREEIRSLDRDYRKLQNLLYDGRYNRYYRQRNYPLLPPIIIDP